MPSPSANPAFLSDWFAARAMLATRRLRAFAPLGVLVFAVAFGGLFTWKKPRDDAPAAPPLARRQEGSSPDTILLVAAVRAARTVQAERDSALHALSLRAGRNADTAGLPDEFARARDSVRTLMSSLDSALDRAAKAPLAASYRALAAMLRPQAGARALVDSLDALDRVRLTLDPVTTPQGTFAQLTERTNDIGALLQNVARRRRAALGRELAMVEGRSAAVAARETTALDTATAGALRDSAQQAVERAEHQLRDARAWLAENERHTDAPAPARLPRMSGSSPVAAAVAALLLAVVCTFVLAVSVEAHRPTIADVREAERLTGMPAHVVDDWARLSREWQARLHPASGIDPFRMVYLALTASGMRERTAVVTGDDPATVALVAGRLAMSSAVDARATLLVDFVPGAPAATKHFTESAEPGFSEAIAGIQLWREVARPVGASEGLSLDMVPAGARRHDTNDSVATATNRDEFRLFAGEYDFTVISAPTSGSWALVAALCQQPATVYVARIGETRHDVLVAAMHGLAATGLSPIGLLLVD